MNSLWLSNNVLENKFKSLDKDISTDVCIIGAGIFGITCAYYLTKLGYSVAVLDKGEVGGRTTGHTTAKITSQHDIFYSYLLDSYGEDFAKKYLYSNQEAIENIYSIIKEENISCDFEWQNSFVYTTEKSELAKIQKEVSVVNSLGFPAQFVTKCGLPFPIEGSICFPKQAMFNPLLFLDGLCNCIEERGGNIFTHTLVTDVRKSGDSYVSFVTSENSKECTVTSPFVIVATHYPFLNVPGFYFTKMYQSTSYLIAIDPKKTLFSGMYISSSSPVYSFRTANYKGRKLLLVGGSDHKTGSPTSYADSYGDLENVAKKYYPNCEVLFRWNTRDCIPLDKIPYIGEYSHLMPNCYVGTGFKKWGMTSANVAANIVVSKICGNTLDYSDIYDSTRVHPLKNFDEMKNILVQSGNSLIFDKLKSPQMSFDEIKNNSGGIIEVNGQKVGIYKNGDGNIFAVKPFCTHLGCLLSWNDVDKTWDCPCHGSRFDAMGHNIYDPAFKDLDVFSLDV